MVADMSNRRSEPRFPADQPVLISEVDTAGGYAGAGRIVDFSASGIGFEVDFSLTAGCHVKIEWPRGIVLGEVRYCLRKSEDYYRAGLKITEVVAIAGITEQTGAA
jgi:PilZ domain